jgi:arylsulfatase A-like enzyme
MCNEDVIQEQPDQRGLTERYAEQCVRFIRENRDRPFFLYLAHMYVHVPLFVPDRFLRHSRNGGYGGAVECIDWVAGCLFDELKRQGIDDNTIVIFTSDNGSRARGEGGSNGPLRGTKFTTWEGGQRVPCIVRWPGKIPAGVVCDELITAMDFLPTLARFAGTTAPTDRVIDGKDISPILLGERSAKSPHTHLFYYRLGNLEAVRKGRWKLRFADGNVFDTGTSIPAELYDLHNDLGETTNCVADHPQIVAELLALADQARADLGDTVRGVRGAGARPAGRVENPRPLAVFDPNHPYFIASYDMPDTGVMAG